MKSKARRLDDDLLIKIQSRAFYILKVGLGLAGALLFTLLPPSRRLYCVAMITRSRG